MLIVFGGLPGTGKTTVGQALAMRRSAVYLRVDEIEQALRACTGTEVGASGYAAAQAIARSNLILGLTVVADSVNPVPASRDGWKAAASGTGHTVVEVELVCSDAAEHRRRVEARVADIPGLRCPSWTAVQNLPYVPWTEPHLVLDTALIGVSQAVDAIEARLAAASAEATSGPFGR